MGSQNRIINIINLRFTIYIIGHGGGVNCIKFSDDGDYFISGGSDRIVMIWKSNIQ